MEITIHCGGIADKNELHARIAAALSVPDWYGHNLDALMDCLTDLDEVTVTLTEWDSLPFDADGFWQAFRQAASENPDLTVIFA